MSALETQTDEQLIAAWKSTRCPTSVNELMDRHLPPIRGLVCRLGAPANDVEDLTQEIFVRAFRGLDSFKSDAKFTTWIYVIAVNRVRQYFVTRKRSIGQNEYLPDVPDPRNDSPDQTIRLSETSQAVQTAMESLSEPLRLAIVLTSTRGVDAEQAARICECSTNAFYARVHKARKLLKQKLARLLE